MNCPYCGTENSADAKECSNCSADFTTLPKGAAPLASTAPTMMSSAAEVAAALAAAKTEKETASDPPADYSAATMMSSSADVAAALAAAKKEEVSEPWTEEPSSESRPDSSAPTMMSSSAEVAAALAAAQSEKVAETESPVEESPLEAIPEPEALVTPSESYAPTMISAVPDEVAAALAAAKPAPDDDSAPMDESDSEMEWSPELTAPTLLGIPDPLGSLEPEEPAVPQAEPEPARKFQEAPTPLFNEPLVIPSPPSTSTPEVTPPKDNTRTYIIVGCGCLALLCLCCVVGVVFAQILLPALQNF